MINKPKKKKQLLVKLKAPYFIHKDVQGTNLTFCIAEYALPWKEISDAPLCDAVITKINKELHGYDIELANGMELSFDRSGRFLGMDD